MKYKLKTNVPVTFHLNEQVHVEKNAFQELENFLKITDTISQLN